MSPAKVTLSPEELELVNNRDWILTKNAVIAKVYTFFGQLSEVYTQRIAAVPSLRELGIDLGSAKISRGEQYEGLPWVMLDHPRYFTRTDVFAIRSFFWWGSYCSLTLQLSGRFADRYRTRIQHHFEGGETEEWYYCVHPDPWQHHFRSGNYMPLGKNTAGHLSTLPFLKIARRFSLTEWAHMGTLFENGFDELLTWLEETPTHDGGKR